MNKKLTAMIIMFLAAVSFLSAQTAKGMSLNGSTGLISIPSARIGWEKSADFGIDAGYHAIMVDSETNHITKVSVSLFKISEIAFAYDSQYDSNNSDKLINGKIQLPVKSSSAVAVGFNYQMLQFAGKDENVNQLYLATTYPGDFFKMPAETTITIGKTFGDAAPEDNIDFGMGFDLLLFPETFKGYIHWINDFANYSYSMDALGSNAGYRGSFNTGIRIDMSTIEALSKYKFVIDAFITDALDKNRAFSIGGSFGLPVK